MTGAPVCDPWFDWEPSRSREEFCREVGLRADRPIVLYLCSSQFVAPNEVGFVPGWIERLQAYGEPFAEAGFLIRPYPDTSQRWLDAGLEGPQVRVWPRFGESPHDDASRRNYFDSIYHAAAVVGINTTAQIESAIVGRPVHTLLAEEFRETQEGTLHFRYLEADEFGLLFVGRTFEEHAEQLEESLRGRVDDGRNERFLRRFVRPLGLDRSAAELVADAIEELGAQPAPAPDRGPRLAPVVRRALWPSVALAGRGSTRAAGQAAATRRRHASCGGPSRGTGGTMLSPSLPGRGWTTRSASSSTGSRSCAGRRPGASACASGCSSSAGPRARPGTMGIGAERVELDEPSSPEELERRAADAFDLGGDDLRVLSPARQERAGSRARIPAGRIQHRLLEFAPLTALAAPPISSCRRSSSPFASRPRRRRWLRPWPSGDR